MKILFISSLFAPNEIGGAERTVRVLADALVTRGHEAVVVSLAPEGVASKSMVGRIRTYYVPLSNIYWPFSQEPRPAWQRALWHLRDAYNPEMGRRVAEIIDEERPDLIQTGNLQGFSVSPWRAAQSRGVPVVQMLHDYYLACPNSSMLRRGRNCTTQCTSCRVFATPRRVLSNIPVAVNSLSRRTLEKVEACGLFDRVEHKYVNHGASNVRCEVAPRADKAPGDALTIGYLGRIDRTKGLEVLFDAMGRLGPGVARLLVAGSGEAEYVASLRGRCPAGDVEFLGFTKPADLFGRIDLLVVPSRWEEPLGRVIYEAYEYGIPSAVSRMGGMPEIVDEGRTGFVFEPDDAEQLAVLLRQSSAQGWPGERFFHACRAKSREFDSDMMIDRYLSMWHTALAAGGGAAAAARA